MEAGGINTANLQSLAQTFGIQEDMFKLGLASIQEALGGLSGASGTVNDIANLNLSETNDLLKAITSFGSAIGGNIAKGGGGSGSPATVYPDPNVPGGYAPGYS